VDFHRESFGSNTTSPKRKWRLVGDLRVRLFWFWWFSTIDCQAKWADSHSCGTKPCSPCANCLAGASILYWLYRNWLGLAMQISACKLFNSIGISFLCLVGAHTHMITYLCRAVLWGSHQVEETWIGWWIHIYIEIKRGWGGGGRDRDPLLGFCCVSGYSFPHHCFSDSHGWLSFPFQRMYAKRYQTVKYQRVLP